MYPRLIKTKQSAPQKTIIRPLTGWIPINLAELWAYKGLLYFLVWRELKVRYKQTVLGVGWAILQPFFMMVVFTLFFGKFIKIPREGISYPLFTYAALLPWLLFSEGVNRSVNSLVQDANLIKKVYFPRLIIPLSGAFTPLVDFVFAFLVFIVMLFCFGVVPTVKILLLPVFMLFAIMTSLAVSLWLAAFNVQYRDVRYTIPFLMQCWFFASPVVYSSASLPESWQLIYSLNPMVGVIEGFRWALLGAEPPTLLLPVSVMIVSAILISGAFYFRRMERNFADIV